MSLVMENWKIGEIHGAFEVIQSLAGADVIRNARLIRAGLVVALAILVSSYIYFLLARSISSTLAQGVDFARNMAKGDFSQKIKVERTDETGVLAGAMNMMITDLGKMFTEILGAVEGLASSSRQLTHLPRSHFWAIRLQSSSHRLQPVPDSLQGIGQIADFLRSFSLNGDIILADADPIGTVHLPLEFCMERAGEHAEQEKDAGAGKSEDERGFEQKLGPQPGVALECVGKILLLEVSGIEIAEEQADAGKKQQHADQEKDKNRDPPVCAPDQLPLPLSRWRFPGSRGSGSFAGGERDLHLLEQINGRRMSALSPGQERSGHIILVDNDDVAALVAGESCPFALDPRFINIVFFRAVFADNQHVSGASLFC
jgi:HAMP domain-containing protein